VPPKRPYTRAPTVLRRLAGGSPGSLISELRRPETMQAGGLAIATLISNAVQLVIVVVFTHLLGADDYGSLAALMSAFLILLVGGQALQVAAARETALGHMGEGHRLSATIHAWSRRLLLATVAIAAAGYVLRAPLGHLVGVPDHGLAAATILPTGVLWMLLSLQRGVLQGLRRYRAVGISLVTEAAGRLVFGVGLVLGGAGVTGAFLGTPLTMALTAIGMAVVLRRRLGHPEGAPAMRSLRALTAGAWAPIAGLGLLALMQNVDVIIVKHRIGGDAAGSYAAASVAAKAVVWVAIGLALQLLPEATARVAAGLNPKPVLRRALAVGGAVALPALVIFAAAPTLLMRVVFGDDLTQAHRALPVLALAMTLLAASYLTVQYLIALGSTGYLWVLGLVALAEPFVLAAGDFTLHSYAVAVLVLQAIACAGVVALAVRTRVPRPATVRPATAQT